MEQKKMKKSTKIGIAAAITVILFACIGVPVYKNVLTDKAENNTANVQEETALSNASFEEDEEKSDQSAADSAVDKSVYMDAAQDTETRIDALLSQMTLEEKAAQMVQPEQAAITLSDIAKYNFGSVLSGGGSSPSNGNTVIHWQNHIDNMKQTSITQTRLGIPLLYGVDAVHGNNNAANATIFPHNIGLGAADDEELMERIGAVTAREVRATGIQWTFAPVLGNARNELWGRTYECFGEDVDIATRLGAAYIRGLQGEAGTDEFLDADHVLGTAKHYIGEGYTVGGQNQGNVVMDETEFDNLLHSSLLDPYKASLDEGVLTVMVSYNSINGLKCHESDYLINEVLKGELGFQGLVVSDYNGVQQVSGNTYKDKVAHGVNAGIDLFMEPNDWQNFINSLVELVNEGTVSQERVDDAVRRILRVKFESGLFEEVVGAKREAELIAAFGGEENRAVAREAVRKSLVLLKNDMIDNQTAMEALANSTNILVAGKKADDIGAQCGGWTISWQGSKGNITEGTTLLEALQNAADGKNIIYNTSGEVSEDIDAVLVVVGEDPYAEMQGDRSFSNLTITNDDKTMLRDLKTSLIASGKEDIPVIAVLFTGRPVTIADYVEDFDAIVAAWLPGTEGDGIADVLLGDYDFTGTLTYTWSWYASDIESKFDESSENLILFQNGTGLTKSGESLKQEGTVVINTKPEKSAAELAFIQEGIIDLSSTGYVLEAENYTENSYLVERGNANNISYVDSWSGEWANAKWNVRIPQAGNYKLHFYIAAAKDSKTVDIYYAPGAITDDGAANRTVVPITKTADLLDYQDFTLDVSLEEGSYEFKFMNSTANGADFRLDRIEFEYLD